MVGTNPLRVPAFRMRHDDIQFLVADLSFPTGKSFEIARNPENQFHRIDPQSDSAMNKSDDVLPPANNSRTGKKNAKL